MMTALYILLVLCVLMIVGVCVRTYLHIQQHRQKPDDQEQIDTSDKENDSKV